MAGLRRVRWLSAALGAALISAGAVSAVATTPSAGAAGAPPGAGRGPVVGTALDQAGSPPVRDMPRAPAHPPGPPQQALAHHSGTLASQPASGPDAALQTAPATVAAPAVTSFEGTNNIDALIPPDTDGAVGPNDYAELVNAHYQVFSKSGQSLAGPIESGSMWSAFSNSSSAAKLCYTNPGGDGIVLYDRAADRWLFSELAFTNGVFGPQGPYVECFAVSKTGDPTGSYFVYAFLMDNSSLPDYPKIGIWGNSYYLSANMFSSAFASSGNPAVWAFNRNAMIAGQSGVQDVSFSGYVPSSYNTILPADVDGATQPPSGSPEIFAGLDFSTNTTLGLWFFSQVNWANPGAATFTGPTNLTVDAYNTLCGGSQNCLPQPGTSQTLDAISDRVMYRLAYRNFGDHEALVVDHSVNASANGTQAGVRWYEIDRPLANGQPNGPFSVAQQGTYAPDSTNRWMGSVAMDGAGDLALGYSAASASLYPSVRFTGRLAGDPAGQMTFSEGTIQSGAGSQTGYNRWGDYTRMAVDPVDDCTFWYVGEYYSNSASYQWQTRIGSFKLSSCTASPDFSLSATQSSQTVVQGSGTSYGVTISAANGFTGSVSLSVSGLPTGASASFNPNPATSSSTMSVTTAATTPIGTYPLTITGTSGTLSHSTSVSLVVNPAADFSLGAAPSSQSFVQGTGGNYTVSVTASGGFNSAVNLAVTGLPSGASGSFSPNPATSTSSSAYTSTLSVTTASSTPAGTYTLTITGTSGSLSHSTTVTLQVTVPDFSIAALPSNSSVPRGGTTTYTVTVTALNGFTGSVGLTVSGLPSGDSGTFNPVSVTGSGNSTLTVTTSGSSRTGTFTLTITGTSGSLTHTCTVSLKITRR